jgi:DNA polymerase I
MSSPLPVVLMRLANGSISATPGDGTTEHLTADELPDFVARRELEHPRWVWDDTTQWYPSLLAVGVRIKHCADLRLRHNICRNSPFVDQTLLAGDDLQQWDNFVADSFDDSTLFNFHTDEHQLDSLAEFHRQQAALEASAHANKLRLLLSAESTAALIAAEMTFLGLPWRADIHNELLTSALGPRPQPGKRPEKLEQLANVIRGALNAPTLNPDSPTELLKALCLAGIAVDDTRSTTLARLDHPAVDCVLAYKKLQRLNTANGWRWLDTWVQHGRYHPTYVPGGVVTGRWAASGGGALSLPAQLRPAVVADPEWILVVADVAQLEPRVLAAMSADEAMAKAARGGDLYQNLVDAKAVATRDEAKLGMLGAMYGATQGQSRAMVTRLAQRYPKAFGLVEAAARTGERGEQVTTFLGRGSPVPDAAWVDQTDSRHDAAKRSWGRFTRNFIVQGTGAEWAMCWMATLRGLLWEMTPDLDISQRPHLVFFLHDEIVVHTPKQHADAVVEAVRASADRAANLMFGSFPVDFPLDVSVVEVYSDAT